MFVSKSTLAGLLVALQVANAHPGEEHQHMHAGELASRQLSANVRHVQARQCASAIAEYTRQRKAKRALMMKRQESSAVVSGTSSAVIPSVTSITNNTCITAPEVTEGPYYIRNEFVRQDLREDQRGIDLTLDIGVMDTTTCTPLSNAFVELWHANATGYYGGFIEASSGSSTSGGNQTMTGSPPTGTDMGGSMSMTGSAPAPAGSQPATGSGGMMSTASTDNSTWLRGGYTTNDAGIVEILTVYPGFYSGRTVHIHMMVHMDYTVAENGTLISDAGTVAHIGQLFMDQSLSAQVFNTSVYLENTNPLTTNDQDSIFAQENADGNDAIMDISLLGATVEDGLFGYITVGVNASAIYSITTTNYNKGETSLTDSAADSEVSSVSTNAASSTTKAATAASAEVSSSSEVAATVSSAAHRVRGMWF